MEKCEARHIFRSTTNVQSGKQEWMAVDEDYDYHQEIARSAYADMLHDSERNEKYYAALKNGIELLRARGERVHLLDIGTGSGILAMMAVNLGADTVTACEVFRPMYECARQVLQANGMASKIKVIPKRSTDMTVGPGCDLEQRANILIAEVFDTELIGEGAISTFNHAHRCLITPDAIVIPSRATIYAQVVQSKVIRRWHQLFPLKFSRSGGGLNASASSSVTAITSLNHHSISHTHSTSGTTTPNYGIDSASVLSPTGLTPAGTPAEVVIRVPPEMECCAGTPSPHDLQLSQIPHSAFEAISEPVPVLFFDFSKQTQPLHAKTCKRLEANNSCYADAVFFWWSLDMDPAGEIVLSCAPHWSRLDGKEIWRDHWLQAIYYPREAVNFDAGQAIILQAAHDEYSVWFDIEAGESPLASTTTSAYGGNSSNGKSNGNNHTNSSHHRHLQHSTSSDSSDVLPKRNKTDGNGDTMANNNTNNGKENDDESDQEFGINSRPLCTCLLHIALGRSRIGAWNDRYRLDKYSLALSKLINPTCSPVCLCLGDGNPLSLICAVLGAAKVFTIEPNSMCASVIERIVEYNNLTDRVKVIRKPVNEVTDQDFEGLKPNLVVAEPEYSYTDGYYLPYLQSLTYWYALQSVRSRQLLAPDVVVIPVIGRLKMLAMEFEDLWKIRAPVGHCTGFDLTPLDNIIQAALDHADPNIEPQPLWEYPGVALSEEHTLMTFDFTNQQELVITSSSSPRISTCSLVVNNSNNDGNAKQEEEQPLLDGELTSLASSNIISNNNLLLPQQVDDASTRPFANRQVGQKFAVASGVLQFMCPGTCNGLAFWIEYTFGGGSTATNLPVSPILVISDGITEPISAGRKPRWSMYHRQGVHLFKNSERVTPARNQLRYSAKLCLADGQMQFSADFESIEDDVTT